MNSYFTPVYRGLMYAPDGEIDSEWERISVLRRGSPTTTKERVRSLPWYHLIEGISCSADHEMVLIRTRDWFLVPMEMGHLPWCRSLLYANMT